MRNKGIRIFDAERVLKAKLLDILKEIQYGDDLQWSILFLYANGPIEGIEDPDFEKKINDSERGLFLSWQQLIDLAPRFFQIIDILIIGCKEEESLLRYNTDIELFEACEIVIEMNDGYYWQILSKDESLLQRYASVFKQTEFVEPKNE